MTVADVATTVELGDVGVDSTFKCRNLAIADAMIELEKDLCPVELIPRDETAKAAIASRYLFNDPRLISSSS